MDRCESFLSACRLGNTNDVENFLEEGISPDIQNAEGESSLQIAAANGFTEIVGLLLKKGASIDLPNYYGWTPLMHAVRHGHTGTVSQLLNMKAKVNICNRLGLRPIDLAAWNGQLTNLKLLIEAGAVIDSISSSNLSNDCDFSPLMIASLRGHDAILRTLLEKGASVNQVSSVTGLTPLMLAACNGHKQIVQIIIEWGGDVNQTDVCCQTALDLAIACNQSEVKGYLEDLTSAKCGNGSSFQNTDILQAVRNGDISEVEAILQQNTNAASAFDPSDGVTPLMLASMLGYENIVSLLVSNVATLNNKDITNGWTALMYAVFHKQASIVHILLENGANVDVCASNGYTALDLARHLDTSDTDILKTLTDALPDNPFQWNNCSPSISDSSKRAFSSVEKFSTRSQSQTRVKDWIGDVAQHLQQKVFVRSTSKHSSASMNIDFEDCDESMSDVFLEKDSPSEATEGPMLCVSMLLSPNKHLSEALNEHIVEAITPPLLPGPTSYMDFMKDFPSKKLPKNKMKKQPVTSLQVPRLLKNRHKLCKESQSEEQDMTISETSDRLEVAKNDSKRSNESSKMLLESESKTHGSDSVDGDLTTLLNKEALKEYVQKFRDQEVDFDTFQCLTDEDLNEIGIPSGSRKKLMEIISKLQNT